MAALLVTAVAVIPMAMVGGASMLFAAGVGCPSSGSGATTQPAVTNAARNSIPADYLALFKNTGQQYRVPWVVLAGIGKVESDDGQSNLPGVHSGQNGFGAAGPMQIGIGGASGNTWGGAPVHPASEVVGWRGDRRRRRRRGQRLRAGGRYRGRGQVPARARRAEQRQRRHLRLQPPSVLRADRPVLGGRYSRGGYTVSSTTTVSAPECLTSAQTSAVPNQLVSTVIGFAQEQLGNPYLLGGTGPDCLTVPAWR